MSNVITLTPDNAEHIGTHANKPYVGQRRPANEMTATQLRNYQNRSGIFTPSYWGGILDRWASAKPQVTVTTVAHNPGLPRHLREKPLANRDKTSKHIIARPPYVAPSKHPTVLHAVAAGERTSRHRHKI